MIKRAILPALSGLAVIGMVTLVAWAADQQEEQITLDQVPAAVRATILKESAGGKITEIERETKNGKTVYEAEFLLNGREIEIEIAPHGTLLAREVEHEGSDQEELTIEDFPAPARAALRKLAGDAKFVELEREREHGVLVYEAQWIARGARHEAAVTADGTLLETEEIFPVGRAPAAVRAAIAKRFGDAKVLVEKKMIVLYEVEGEMDGKEVELLIHPTGHVRNEHGEHDDDDDD